MIAKNHDLANKSLKEINASEYQGGMSFVDYDLLTKFFSQSLRSDNFDGVIYSLLNLLVGTLDNLC